MGFGPGALEAVVLTRPDPAFWAEKRVLLTGHTGFKGGWTAIWLADLGAKVTGLALAPEGRTGGWLVVSSQGDNAYALYRLPDLAPAGRFRISGGALGATEETDGIALALGRFGRTSPEGLFIAQDGDNAPAAQNFKLASWADILKAMRAGAP